MLAVAFATLLAQGETSIRYVVAAPMGQTNALPTVSADGKWAATLDTHGQGLIYAVDPKGKGTVVQAFQLAPTYRQAANFTNYQDMRGMLSISPHGRFLAVGDANGKRSHVYRVSPWKEILAFDNAGYTYSGEWSPDETRLLCNTVSADQRGQFTRVVRIGDGESQKVAVMGPFAFPRGGKTAIGLGRSGPIEFSLETGKTLRALSDSVETMAPIALSPDGKYLVTGGEDPAWKGPYIGPNDPAPSEAAYAHQLTFKIWRMSDGKRLSVLPGPFSGSGANPADPLFLGDDRVAFLTTGRVYRLSSGKKVGSLPQANASQGIVLPPTPGKPLAPRPLALPAALQSPKFLGASHGRLLLGFPGNPGRLAVVDAISRRWIFLKLPGISSIERAVGRKDGAVVLLGGGKLGLLAADSRSIRALLIPKLKGNSDFDILTSLSVSPDGMHGTLASLGPGESVTWRLDDGKVVARQKRAGLPGSASWSGPSGITYQRSMGLRSGIQVNLPSGKTWSFVPQHMFGTSPHFDAKGERVAMTEWMSDEMDRTEQWLDVLRTSDGKSLAKVKIPSAGDIALSGDGERVAIARPTGIEVRAFPDFREAARTEVAMPQAPQLGCAQTSAGERFILHGYGSPVAILDGNGVLLAQIAAWADGAWVAWTPSGALEGNEAGVSRMRISRDGRLGAASRTRPDEVWIALGAKSR